MINNNHMTLTYLTLFVFGNIVFFNTATASLCEKQKEMLLDGEVVSISEGRRTDSSKIKPGDVEEYGFGIKFRLKDGTLLNLNGVRPIYGGFSVGDSLKINGSCGTYDSNPEFAGWPEDFEWEWTKKFVVKNNGWCRYDLNFLQVKGRNRSPIEMPSTCDCNNSPAQVMKEHAKYKKLSEKKSKDGKPSEVDIEYIAFHSGYGVPVKTQSYYFKNPDDCRKQLLNKKESEVKLIKTEEDKTKKKLGDYE